MGKLIILMLCCTGSLGAILPFLQVMLRNIGCSLSVIGLVGSLSDVFSIIIPLIFSRIADKAGHSKGTLSMGVTLYMVLFVPAALCHNPWIACICLALATGFSAVVLPLSDSLSTSYLNGDSMSYGIARSFGSFGYIVVCLVLGLTGYPNTSSNASILSCILIAGSITLISVSIFPKGYESRSQSKPIKLKNIGSILTKPFLMLMLIVSLQRFSWTFVDKFVTLYLKEELGFGDYYLFLTALGPLLEIVFMLFGGRLLQKEKLKASSLVLVGCLGIFSRYILYFFFHDHLAGILLAQLMHGVSFGAFQMGSLKLISNNIEKEHYPLAIGLYYSLGQRLPLVIGSMFGGFIIDSYGYGVSLLFFAFFGLLAAIVTIIGKGTLDGKKV